MSLCKRALFRGIVIAEASSCDELVACIRQRLSHNLFDLRWRFTISDNLDEYDVILYPDIDQFTDQVLLSCARTLPTIKVYAKDRVVFETDRLKEDSTIADLLAIMDKPYMSFARDGNVLGKDSRVYGGVKAGKIEVI